MLNLLTLETFIPNVGTIFRIARPGGTPVDLRLTDVESLGASPGVRPDGTPRRAPFSVIFAGPMEPILPQRIYYLEHPAIPGLEIFIVPIGPRDGSMRYQAVFN